MLSLQNIRNASKAFKKVIIFKGLSYYSHIEQGKRLYQLSYIFASCVNEWFSRSVVFRVKIFNSNLILDHGRLGSIDCVLIY